MTSVDSGVETSNDSNDSYAAHDPQSPLEISPIKSVSPAACHCQPTSNSPSSSCEPGEDRPAKERPQTNKDLSVEFIFEPDESPASGVEPPAGLTFCNLQPLPLSFSSGYELLGPGCRISLACYQKSDLQRKLRSVRCCLKGRRDPWHLFKEPLDERKLRCAVITNNVERVVSLLENGVNPNCSDEQLRSPLHLAACKGYCDIVRLLLERGANPNQRDSLGNTPLHLAACTNNVGVVTLLLKAGTDVSSNDHYGRNPLQLAQSKLKLLQRGHLDDDSNKIKKEVQQVIEMMQTFLHKEGHDLEAELLNAFSSRLTLSQTKEEVETGVRELLASLGNLSLSKAEQK